MDTFECELCSEPRPDEEARNVMHDDARMTVCDLCYRTAGDMELIQDARR